MMIRYCKKNFLRWVVIFSFSIVSLSLKADVYYDALENMDTITPKESQWSNDNDSIVEVQRDITSKQNVRIVDDENSLNILPVDTSPEVINNFNNAKKTDLENEIPQTKSKKMVTMGQVQRQADKLSKLHKYHKGKYKSAMPFGKWRVYLRS